MEYFKEVEIHKDELTDVLNEYVNHVNDTSWINKLTEYKREPYKIRAEKTISKIVGMLNEALEEGSVCKEAGEYVISIKALKVLEADFNHSQIPLAELFKEKVSGNPGFDFFSICPEQNLYMGEAKYLSENNAYSVALDQIYEFVTGGKDIAQLPDLESFAEVETLDKFKNKKGYVAAFSLNCQHNKENLNKKRQKIFEHDNVHEVILIGVKICKS